MKLLNFDNAKTRKGEAFGYSTAILYLAPASLSGKNVCEHSTSECRALCLNTAGMGVFKKIQDARIAKTKYMHDTPMAFYHQLDKEIQNFVNLCKKRSDQKRSYTKPCVRLNGTSDIYNSHIETIIKKHWNIKFYDYTKDVNRMNLYLNGKLPSNYFLLYSCSGTDESIAISERFIDRGANVAVVFDTKKGEPLPLTWNYFQVIDGDVHDLRFINAERGLLRQGAADDEPYSEGNIIGLRAKGKARKAKSGDNHFVQKGVSS